MKKQTELHIGAQVSDIAGDGTAGEEGSVGDDGRRDDGRLESGCDGFFLRRILGRDRTALGDDMATSAESR